MANQIATGTFLRNGGNRYFKVTLYNDSTVTLQEYNADGPMDSYRNFSRSTFDGLYRMRNFAIVSFLYSIKQNRWIERRDIVATKSLGLERYMVKQTYNF
jgi:hypothetical protein